MQNYKKMTGALEFVLLYLLVIFLCRVCFGFGFISFSSLVLLNSGRCSLG